MRKKLFLVSIVMLLLITSACSSGTGGDGVSKGKQDTLIVTIPAEVGILDPGVTMDNSAWKITYSTYERLVAYDGEKTTVKPSLAKEWNISDDGKTYTFYLEEGHKFSDGTEVTAEAVKFSFERTLKIAKGPSELYSIINEIKVIDPYTVEFQLDTNFPPFLSTLAANYGSILNPKVMEHEKDGDLAQNFLATNTMGSGPYQLAEYKKGQYYKLTLNPNSKLKPALTTVFFQISSDISEARLKLEKGEIDIAEGIPTDHIVKLKEVDGIHLAESPSLLVDYLYINIGKGNEILKDTNFRKSLNYGVNYQSIIEQTMQGYGKQFKGPVPEGLWGHNGEGFPYTFDQTKAKELVNKTAYKGGELSLLYSDHRPYWEQLALVIQSNLAEVGIHVKLNKVAYATMREMIDRGEFDLCLGVWSPDYGDPYMFMNYWFDSDNWGLAGNRSFYKNEEVDHLIRKAATISDQKEREALYKQAQGIIVEDAVYLYIAQREFILPMRENIKGFVYNPMLEGIYNLEEMSK